MSFLAAMNNGAADAAKRAAPNPASLGIGAVPDLPGLPPKPKMVGEMPIGSPGTTEKTARDDAIASLRTLQGFKPSMRDDIEAFISKLKTTDQPESKPPLGEPIPPGGPVEASQVQESGSPGNY